MMMKRKIHRIILPLWLLTAACAVPAEAPTGLLCNLLTHPEKSVLTEPIPEFGWTVNSPAKEDYQTAYQILVASSRESLLREKGDLWDSGKINSPQSINIPYRGKPLAPNSSYWWSVRTWTRKGGKSAFSEPQQFHAGEFGRANQKWPGESRWVQLSDGPGGLRWTFENRPPVEFHAQPVSRMLARPDGSWFLDFGKAAFATLEVTIDWTPTTESTTNCLIQIAVGEKSKGDAVDPKPGGGIIYSKMPMTLRPGKHRYTLEVPRFVPKYPHSQAMPLIMPEVIPFRYCEILPGVERIKIEGPRQLALWSEFDDEAGSFTSSVKALNEVYDLCKYSVKVNTFNGDYASSQRERMMYEADTYIHQMSHYAVDRGFAIARYSHENMIFHASWPTEWISHSILMAWADYWHTGNKRSLERYYDELKPKTLQGLTTTNGLVSTRTGSQSREFRQSIHFNGSALKDIVDWPTTEADQYDFRDFNTVVNAFHHRSLVLMAQIAEALGKGADARSYRADADRVRAAFNASFLDARRGVYVDGIGSEHVSLHANLFPLAFGLVPDAHRSSVIEYVKSRGMACGVYPTVYLLEALFDEGEAQAAIDLMTSDSERSWLNMIQAGSTVTMEAWDLKYKWNCGWTHAWSTAPVQILPRKLVGIEPLEAGFGRIRIQPRPGNVATASAKVPTIRGTVAAEFQQTRGAFELKVTIPANVSAEVMLPALGTVSRDVLVDGRRVRGRVVGNEVRVELGSGTHHVMRRASQSTSTDKKS